MLCHLLGDLEQEELLQSLVQQAEPLAWSATAKEEGSHWGFIYIYSTAAALQNTHSPPEPEWGAMLAHVVLRQRPAQGPLWVILGPGSADLQQSLP